MIILQLLWATLVLGIRLGLTVGGFLLGVGVALAPIIGRILNLLTQEAFRIYSRHHLEVTPARGFLALAAWELVITVGLGIAVWYIGELLITGILMVLGGIAAWITSIELVDIRYRHSDQLEEYLSSWHRH